MHGTTLGRIKAMMPVGKLKQMPQPGQPTANQLLKNIRNKKVRMRKKKAIHILRKNNFLMMIIKKMNNLDLILCHGFKVSMLGLKIKVIAHMKLNGKLRLIILLKEMLQLGHYLKRKISGDQFLMNRLNRHHQVTQPNLS